MSAHSHSDNGTISILCQVTGDHVLPVPAEVKSSDGHGMQFGGVGRLLQGEGSETAGAAAGRQTSRRKANRQWKESNATTTMRRINYSQSQLEHLMTTMQWWRCLK